MSKIALRCQCGEVQGQLDELSSKNAARIVCYCADCQAFAKHLKKDEEVLDDAGGTDIVQTVPSNIHIESGKDQLACIKLTEKGLYRWYAGCCNSPIMNCVGPGMPFVGLFTDFVADKTDIDNTMGNPAYYTFTKTASGPVTGVPQHKNFPLGYLGKTILRLLIWKVQGKDKPHPLFSTDGQPLVSPEVLNK